METQTKSYAELMSYKTFEERFEYLKLAGSVGEETFGRHARYLNQKFYQSKEWRDFRRRILVRDLGDLGCEDHPLCGPVVIHHINPITEEQILSFDPMLLDPDNVVAVTSATHKAIHFSELDSIPTSPIERRPGDTCPWKESR